jgi:hypothetical protein
MRQGLALVALLVALLATTGCSIATDVGIAGREPTDIPINIDNGTNVAVGLYVDGAWVGTYAAGSKLAVPMPAPRRLPTTIELRSPSDAPLLSVTLDEGQHAAAEAGGYGAGASQGLPCGVLTLLVGRLADGEALAPAESVEPGTCP